MRRSNLALAAAVLAMCTLPANTQQKGPGRGPDIGVAATTLIDQPDVQVGRGEIQPGASRSMHAHNDVQFHLFIVLSGTVQLTIGSDAPVEMQAGEVRYIKAGTQHGFKNTGSTPARTIEVFVKPPVH